VLDSPTPTTFVTLLKTFGKNVSNRKARKALQNHEKLENYVFFAHSL
jgi:hypothetical protein